MPCATSGSTSPIPHARMPVPIANPSDSGGQPWPAPGLAAPTASAIPPRHTADVRFQADVLKYVTDAIIALDLDGCITYWNAGAERLHGLRTADVLGRPLSDCVSYGIMPDPDEDLPATSIADARAAIQHAADGTGDLIYEAPDGARRVVSSGHSAKKSRSLPPDDREMRDWGGSMVLRLDPGLQRDVTAPAPARAGMRAGDPPDRQAAAPAPCPPPGRTCPGRPGCIRRRDNAA